MKKRLAAFMIMMCVFCMSVGFPAAAEEEQSTEAAEENLLMELEDVNAFETLVSQYGSMCHTLRQIEADGTEHVYQYHQDEEWYIEEDEWGILVWDGEENVYFEAADDGSLYQYLFLEDWYESFKEARMDSPVRYIEEEQIVSEEAEDGLIYLYTTEPADSYDTSFLESYGYGEEDVDSFSIEYIIDEETKAILEIRTYVVSGEEEILLLEGIMELGCGEYALDEDLEAAMSGENAVTVSVIADAGTDEEQTYTVTLTKGYDVFVYGTYEYEDMLYTDAECTIEAEDYVEGEVYYLKRMED
ncbi:MAG: hypothetical protein LUD16_03220 [Lachnospiraceae bacterium]|nr:hypothetical protein [Lachnospiraceae bacterium]